MPLYLDNHYVNVTWEMNKRINIIIIIIIIIKGKVPVLNEVPRREDVLGEWRYSSTHS
jgi:hypothetical protein